MKNEFKITKDKNNIQIYYKNELIFNNDFKLIEFDYPMLLFFQKKYEVLGVEITEAKKQLFDQMLSGRMNNIILSNLLYKKIYKINI